MISSYIQRSSSILAASRSEQRRGRGPLRHVIWLCILLACLGSSWFAFQVLLVPQPREFAPDWQGARWIQAIDVANPASTDASPVAYFRYTLPFDVLPDRAFITVTASQVFRLYVNGIYIGSNTMDFVRGETPQTYMYDIDSTLVKGVNVVGLRVANVDQGVPQMRANIGVIWGNQTHYYPSGPGWQATMRASLAHPRDSVTGNTSSAPTGKGGKHPAAHSHNHVTDYDWSRPTFNAGQWPASGIVTQPPFSPPLLVNPRIYEQPLPTHWLSAGPGEESYFVRRVTIPANFENALLRIVAIGEADIFINDHLFMRWNGQANTPQINVVNYLSTNGQPAPYRNGLMLGVYDVSPYLHAGKNVIAVHIIAPGTSMAKVGLETLRGAMSLDMLIGVGPAGATYSNPLASDAGWHASLHPVEGWTRASDATFAWAPPLALGRPGFNRTFYLPDSNTPRNVQLIPPLLTLELVLVCCVLVVLFWLLLGLLVLRRYYATRRAALEAASLAFLPALALEAFLLTLSRQPQLPQPFPYTWQWGIVLFSVLLLSAALLWWQARRRMMLGEPLTELVASPLADALPCEEVVQPPRPWRQRVWAWLLENWALLPLLLLAIPLVCYDITYEPYWQDELASYTAALGIMWRGYPAFLSGVIYPKAELFSLNLAILMTIFGTHSYLVPRLVSVILFLVSLPLLYIVGSRLFNRTVAWLATAMLLFSPYAMIWSRQARMYEQAQFMVIVVLFAFHWALQHRDRVLSPYLAILMLLVAYFSHEEVFIILPAVIICVLVGSREGPYGIPAVLRKKHWWIAALIGATIIATQLTIVFVTHPPLLGTDQSQRPQIQLTMNNIPYYFSQLFMPRPLKDSPTVWVAAPVLMTLHSLLAVLGCVLAFWRRDRRASYCALFLLFSCATLIFVFTMQADRYYYALWPVHFLMAAYALWWLLRTVWNFARPHLASRSRTSVEQLARPVRLLMAITTALICAAVLLVPVLPLTNYSLLASRLAGVPYRRHYADYDNVARYMNAHMKQGDVVISIAPAVITLFYVGQADYYYSYDRALFLFEKDNQMHETTTGSHPLLNQEDVNAVLAKNSRVWIVTDNAGYQGGATKNGRFVFPPPGFRMVYEGYGSAVYFRGA